MFNSTLDDGQQGNQTIEETMPVRPNINSDLIRWMISGDEIAQDIEVELTGRKLYNGKMIIINPNKRRLINDEGINSIKIIITSHIGKGSINSNLNEDDINFVMKDIRRDLDDKLYMHWNEWGVIESDCSTIRAIVENNVLFAVKRALEGKELARWTGTVKRTEVSNTAHKKSGILGWMGLK